jgi:hypothetical protein
MMSVVPEQKAVNEDAIKHEQDKEARQREWLKKKD